MPLIVVQGTNDPRLKKAESDKIVIALRDRGFPMKYLVASDEGHGFASLVNNMAAVAAMEKFLARHLGGRFQEGTKSEVAMRLTEVTEDQRRGSRPKKVDAASVGVPKLVSSLQAGTSNMQAKIKMGGQTRPIAAELGGQLFANGAGSHAVMAALPVAEGYATTFRNFDLQRQKAKMLQLKVVGVEQFTVPAGTFEAFKCAVTSAEGEAETEAVVEPTRRRGQRHRPATNSLQSRSWSA